MVTIRDVALKSGVSVATVSYVLNDGPRTVRPETRERVQAAIEHLKYRPNVTARHLARRRTHTLGVIIGNGSLLTEGNPYTATVVSGILTRAGELGYNVTLVTENWREKGVKSLLANLNIEGILIIAPLLGDSLVEDVCGEQMPMVVLSSTVHAVETMCIDVDNGLGVQKATEHLIALGHQRIACVSGDVHQPSTPLRREGFHRAMKTANLPIRAEYDVISSFSGKKSRQDIEHLLSLLEPPTALLAGNDYIAFVALEVAHEKKIRVPQDLSVVGFDDAIGASLSNPPLTTVRQPLSEMAGEAVEVLIEEIRLHTVSGEQETRKMPLTSPKIVRPDLVVRSSTGPYNAEITEIGLECLRTEAILLKSKKESLK
jgi:LacI family transcriptional regulator